MSLFTALILLVFADVRVATNCEYLVANFSSANASDPSLELMSSAIIACTWVFLPSNDLKAQCMMKCSIVRSDA